VRWWEERQGAVGKGQFAVSNRQWARSSWQKKLKYKDGFGLVFLMMMMKNGSLVIGIYFSGHEKEIMQNDFITGFQFFKKSIYYL
jgi:hypothetical protein